MAEIQCDVAIYPAYARADIESMLAVLPASKIVLVHTSLSGAGAFATVFAEQFPETEFVVPSFGPYNP
jgi:hypothetical protein